MKTYKSLTKLILVLGLLSGVVSCKKQLEDVIPQDQLSSQEALTNPSAIVTLYTGVYEDLRGYTQTLFSLGESRAETWADGLFTESGDSYYSNMYDHNISALNVPFTNWGNFYSLIYQVNNCIQIFTNTTVLSAAVKNQYLADMYGIRAYLYYTMAKTWGNVPLITQTLPSLTSTAQSYVARTPVDSVFLQIKSDIAQSLTLYNGSSIPGGKRVYWNNVATLVLKGDVYLWTGTVRGGGAADLNTAQTALQQVENMEGPTLQLNANYADIFDPNKKANNPEIICAINFEVNQASNSYFSEFLINPNNAPLYAFQQAPNSPTVKTVYPYVSGSDRVGMTQAMINKLTSGGVGGAADQRIANSFKVIYGTSAPYATAGVMLTKWIGTTSGTAQIYNNDFPIYRYADVLLLMAEAKSKLGLDPSAEINKLRARAYGAAYVVANPYVSSSVNNNIQAVLEEQLREEIGEGKRWWALRRCGDQWVYNYINPVHLSLATVTSGKGPTLELPISISMLSSDPLYTQTAGY